MHNPFKPTSLSLIQDIELNLNFSEIDFGSSHYFNIYIGYNESLYDKLFNILGDADWEIIQDKSTFKENPDLLTFLNETFSNSNPSFVDKLLAVVHSEKFKKIFSFGYPGLEYAFFETLSRYQDFKKNETISKNFLFKLLSFCSNYMENRPRLQGVCFLGKPNVQDLFIFDFLAKININVIIASPNDISWKNHLKNLDPSSYHISEFELIKKIDFSKLIQGLRLKNVAPEYLVLKRNLETPFKDFLKFSNEDPNFLKGPSLTLPTFFGVCNGFDGSVDEYKNELFKLKESLSQSRYSSLILEKPPEKPKNFELIESFKNLYQKKGDSLESFYRNFFNFNINIISLGIENTLKLYWKNKTYNNSKNILLNLSLVNFLKQNKAFVFENFDKYNKKVLALNIVKEDDFIYFELLHRLGIDVLIINSEESVLDYDKYSVQSFEGKSHCSLEAFPEELSLTRTETTAFKAEEELEEILYCDTNIFRPWQLENYESFPLTLRTTFDEIFILWKEEARMRPNFEILGKKVYVPNIFAKISGTKKDMKEYWSYISRLSEKENSLLVENNLYKNNLSREKYYQASFFIKNTGLDVEAIRSSELYQYSHLRPSIQSNILEKTEALIYKDGNFSKEPDKEFQLKILNTLLNLPESVISLLENYDFPFEIPKLVLFSEDNLSEQDYIIIAFLNLYCFDIVIFNQKGNLGIENNLNHKLFDVHSLEEFGKNYSIEDFFNYNKKKTSFFSRILNFKGGN